MKLCFLNDADFLGGGEIWTLRASRYLQALGNDVTVASPRGSALDIQCKAAGLDRIGYVKSRPDEAPEAELRRSFQERNIDLVYCTVMGNFCESRALGRVADAINASRGRKKMAAVLKTGLPPIGHLTPQHYGCGAGQSIRRLHVVAPAIRQHFLKWEPAFGSFIEVFREGVELEEFRLDATSYPNMRQCWQIPDHHVVVACVARLVDGMKGQSVLLRSIPKLLEAHPGTVFVFAGEGEGRALLEELAADLNVSSAVRFTGHIDDVAALLSGVDILCHPSLHDGLPNAVVEAMAMGVPVVASRVGAIHELVADGISGILVRPNDVNELTSAMDRLLHDDGSLRKRFGAEGRERVQRDWDLGRNLAALNSRLCEELAEFVGAPDRVVAPACSPTSTPILFVLNSIRTGGEETEVAILAKYLDRRRFTMSVVSLEDGGEAAPALDKINGWGISVDETCHQIPGYRDKVQYLLAKISQEGIRIVVACHNPQLVYDAFAHLTPQRCRLIEHGGTLDDVRCIPKDRTARYLGVSSAIAFRAASRMQRRDRAIVIPSMVDTDEFESDEWEAARAWRKQWICDVCLRPFGFPDETCIVVFVGRYDPRKRIEDFIRAADQLRCDPVPSLFLIVGGPDALHTEYAAELEERSRSLVDAHRLVFTGPRNDVTSILCAADILVLPSTGEGMAHVISEAGAAGLAVVASDDGAAREQLDDGTCGVLFDPGNVQQLTDALRMLIGDRSLRVMLGDRLRQRVRNRYSAHVVIEQWHSVLEEIVGEIDGALG